MPFRVGSHYGIHIYEHEAADPSPDDVPVATAMTEAYAKQIVSALNNLPVIMGRVEQLKAENVHLRDELEIVRRHYAESIEARTGPRKEWNEWK